MNANSFPIEALLMQRDVAFGLGVTGGWVHDPENSKELLLPLVSIGELLICRRAAIASFVSGHTQVVTRVSPILDPTDQLSINRPAHHLCLGPTNSLFTHPTHISKETGPRWIRANSHLDNGV